MNESPKYVTAGHTWADPWNDDKEVTCEYQFRKPGRADIARFTKEGPKSVSMAQNNLLISLIHPDDAERLKRDLEEYPALLTTLSGWVMKGSGFGDMGN